VRELRFAECRRDGPGVVDISIVVVPRLVENSAATRASVLTGKPLASALLAEGMCIVQQYGTLFRTVDGRVDEISGAEDAGGGVFVDNAASFDGV
jgi:hypothetical protein